MAIPWREDDGDMFAALVIKRSYRHPFAAVGVLRDFECIVRFRQDKRGSFSFTAMDKLVTPFGPAYLVDLGDMDDTGDGMMEYDVTYSCIPSNRIEGASVNFTEQWFRSVASAETPVNDHIYFYDVNFDIAEQTFTCSGQVQYEYFANVQPDPLLKPRVFLLWEKLVQIAGTPTQSGRVVAEDSEVSIYKGKIWQRRTVYVNIAPASDVPVSA